MRAGKTRPRGAALFIFIVVFIGGALTGTLIYERIADFETARKKRAQSRAAENARDSLVNYMLARSARPLNIARPIGRKIPPRLLMLPCPDNLGDQNLDGTQDPSCGADGTRADAVRGILDSGSRFGRLPYRTKFSAAPPDNDELNDGLGEDFRDPHGNRLWYAVSQNFVPSANPKPLNLHRLDSVGGGWLSVVRAVPRGISGVPPSLSAVETRAAAVVLAPGKHRPGRLPEEFLFTASLSRGAVNPSLYFESRGGQSNADADGVFILGRADRDFDDSLAYISFGELLNPRGAFMRGYRAYTGASGVHNAPVAGSPLAGIYRALADWKNVFGFYPPPAANTARHIETMRRHCAASQTETAGAGAAASGQPFLLPATAEVFVSGAAETVTATLRADSAVLAARGVEISSAAPVSAIVNDSAAVFQTVTLARYARATLFSGARVVVKASVLRTVLGSVFVPAGAALSLAGAASVSFPTKTPLASPGAARGWFPQHRRTAATVSRDGGVLNFRAATAAGFLGETRITSAANTITMRSSGVLTLPAGGRIKIEQDYGGLNYFHRGADAVYEHDGTVFAFPENDYKPPRRDFIKRNFVLLLLSDSETGAGLFRQTIYAPQVVYPWRAKTSPSAPAVSRDNLHPYPPCFDSREMRTAEKTFVENQNIYYAVSPGCRYGSPERCGENGFTVAAESGTQIAAAAPFAFSHSFTATVRFRGGAEQIVFTRGAADRNLTLAEKSFLSADDNTRFELPPGFAFAAGQTATVRAGARITAGDRTRIENAEAVLIYSPAPARHVRCAPGMPPPSLGTAGTLTLAAQGGPGADLTVPCQWLDDGENADGDLDYIVRPLRAKAPAFNDFFMFFGGRVRID